jgi:hypothetical protein
MFEHDIQSFFSLWDKYIKDITVTNNFYVKNK